jgi:hypothetical protein
MNNRNAGEMHSIREGWSDEERENRRRVAAAIQLRLRQLVELSKLIHGKQESENRQMAMASAC